MPSGAKLKYLCKGSNFLIQNWSQKSLENLKTTLMSAMYKPIQGICMPDLYVTRRIRRAKIIFSMFLTFFRVC